MQAPGCRGAALPIVDVTIPGRASFLDGIAVCFSLMPLFLGLMAVVGMFWTRKLSLLCVVFFWITLLVLCEVLKGIVPGDRPFGSCAVSSGHGPTVVIIAFAFLMWLSLEMIIHQPQILRLYRLGYVVAACMLLGPIPAARSRLRDHSALQLGIGVIIGICAGIVWFLLMKFFIGGRVLRWIGLLKARVKCLQFINIKNDYFTSREVYDEQVRKYREEGIFDRSKRKSAAGLGETDFIDDGGGSGEGEEAGEALEQHRQNHDDIFGDSDSSFGVEGVSDDGRTSRATATDLEEAFSPRSAGASSDPSLRPKGDKSSISTEEKNRNKKKNKKKTNAKADMNELSLGMGGGGSTSLGQSGGTYASPLVPFASPFSGLDSAAAAAGGEQSLSSPSHAYANARSGGDGRGGGATAAPPQKYADDSSALSSSSGGARQQHNSQSNSRSLHGSPLKSALKKVKKNANRTENNDEGESSGMSFRESAMSKYNNNKEKNGAVGASDSNEASTGRPGVRAGFVAFAE